MTGALPMSPASFPCRYCPRAAEKPGVNVSASYRAAIDAFTDRAPRRLGLMLYNVRYPPCGELSTTSGRGGQRAEHP